MSLRLQNEGQKKLTDITDAHGVFDHGFFLTFPFDANRFQTDLQALPLAAADKIKKQCSAAEGKANYTI